MSIQYCEARARTLRVYLGNPHLREGERQVIMELLYSVECEMEALDAKAMREEEELVKALDAKAEEERVDHILQAFERR